MREFMNPNPLMLRDLVGRKVFEDHPLVVADVGASGGIAPAWRFFGDDLMAFGFDVNAGECERLNAKTANPNVRYFPLRLGFDGYADLFPEDKLRAAGLFRGNMFNNRSSSKWAKEINAGLDRRNRGPRPELVSDKTSLDAFFVDRPEVRVDFIKIDTDGDDYEVILGARQMLTSHPVLGVMIEAQFHGANHEHANVFANIDRELRGMGFSLFNLDLRRYSRKDLPAPFRHDIFAETETGQLSWADAVYFRDAAQKGYEQRTGVSLSSVQGLKLACLYELFNLPDCAAEAVNFFLPALEPSLDPASLLDRLVPEVNGERPTYEQYITDFKADPGSLFPKRDVSAELGGLMARVKRRLKSRTS